MSTSTKSDHADPLDPGSLIDALAINAMSHGADAIARHNGKVIFVRGGAPGDIADVVITDARPRFSRAAIRQVRSPADVRREPPCRYIGRCGGCQWQHLSYAGQLQAKYRNLVDHLVRIAGLSSPPVRPIIASPDEWRYRHRVTLRVDGHHLGFYRAESHELIEIEECLIATDSVDQGLGAARRWLAEIKTTVRRLSLVASEHERGIVLVANAEGRFVPDDDTVNRRLVTKEPADLVRGVVMFGSRWHHTWGNIDVSATVDGIPITTSGGEFTQVNLAGNRLLVDTVLDLSGIVEGDEVIDLYSGAGNLTLPVARRGARVVGVERSARATKDAETTARGLHLTNCQFVCAPVEAALARFAAEGRTPRIVILDPPRGGAVRILDDVVRLRPARLIYVSCDPPSLARDLGVLIRNGYRLDVVQPIDLFPHTYHLEVVAALEAS